MKSMLVLTFTPTTVPDTEEATDYLFSKLMDVWIYLSPIKWLQKYMPLAEEQDTKKQKWWQAS